MSLLDKIEGAVENYIEEEVERRLQQIRLDGKRIGGDVSNLADQLSNMMRGLESHKIAIEEVMDTQQKMYNAMVNKSAKDLPYPPLHSTRPVGRN